MPLTEKGRLSGASLSEQMFEIMEICSNICSLRDAPLSLGGMVTVLLQRSRVRIPAEPLLCLQIFVMIQNQRENYTVHAQHEKSIVSVPEQN